MEKYGDGVINEEGAYEVENQFILRLPPAPAASLKAVVQSGVLNLKDRLSIQIDQDMRHGTVRFDNWTLGAKIVDLPCIIETHKTLDKKNFYKTADICQMMIAKEQNADEVKEEKQIGKDGKDKRFIFSHGITPPLKNVRKKRFRKTLKKKVVDVPEIEKEVKRLFRTDNEAIHVRYEVVNGDEESSKDKAVPSPAGGFVNHNSQSLDLVEHDLFGEVLSSSEEEEEPPRLMHADSDENSRMSMGLSKDAEESNGARFPTEFSKGMLTGLSRESAVRNETSSFSMPTATVFDDRSPEASTSTADAVAALEQSDTARSFRSDNANLLSRLGELEKQLADLSERRAAQETEIASIDNLALRQRFQSVIDNLKDQEAEKRKEYDEIMSKLN